jgi:hypothetical protein
MLVSHDERGPIARLLTFLEHVSGWSMIVQRPKPLCLRISERVGEAILTRIEQGLAKRAAPFGRLRRILLHLEEAHHGFGRRTLERAMAAGRVDAKALRCRAKRYLALTDQMVLALSDLFESIAEDPAAWAQDARNFLPEWLREEPIAVGRS